jgi:hypothetical protein
MFIHDCKNHGSNFVLCDLYPFSSGLNSVYSIYYTNILCFSNKTASFIVMWLKYETDSDGFIKRRELVSLDRTEQLSADSCYPSNDGSMEWRRLLSLDRTEQVFFINLPYATSRTNFRNI